MDKLSYEHTLGIKVEESINAKAVYYIKQQTGLSLTQIKEKIKENDYIFEVIVGDLEGLQKINRMKVELDKLDAICHLFQDDEEKSSQFFDNIEQRGIEIAQESAY